MNTRRYILVAFVIPTWTLAQSNVSNNILEDTDWEVTLNSFDQYKDALIEKCNKAVVEISGTKSETINLNDYSEVNFSDFFSFDNKSKNKKQDKTKYIPGEKKIEFKASGIAISKDGYILTTYSAIEGCTNLSVKINEHTYVVTSIRYDRYFDIALLKINANNLDFLSIDKSSKSNNKKRIYQLRKAEPCSYKISIRSLTCDGKNKKQSNNKKSFSYNNSSETIGSDILYLIDLNGNLIGITGHNGYDTTTLGNFYNVLDAYKIDNIVQVLKSKDYYTHDVCGLKIIDNNKDLAKKKGLKTNTGCVVVDVDNNMKILGFVSNDIITALNGCSISDMAVFYNVFKLFKNYDMCFTVNRQGKEEIIKIPFGTMSNIKIEKHDDTVKTKMFVFKSLNEKQKRTLYDSNIAGGIYVEKADDKSGIKKGFVITDIEHDNIYNIDDLYRSLKSIIKRYGDNNMLSILVEGYYIDDLSNKICVGIKLS